MLSADYVIVGSGLTGATVARQLHDAGREVVVLERRSHLGGNVYDYVHESGIRIQTYGPHYFRTSSNEVWEYVNRFASFDPYEACVKSRVNGRYENWPIAESYIAEHVGRDWVPPFEGEPRNLEEASLSLMPKLIYERFVKEYNEKQWGVPARQLSKDLCRRFDVRDDDEPRLTPNAKYQGLPEHGYAELMRRMLDGIPLVLNYDYLVHRHSTNAKRALIYTGPIDEFSGFDLGRLVYRGQDRHHRYVPDIDFSQPCAQINNPTHCGGPHIRTLEWKHMMRADYASRIRGTVLTRETPITPTNPGSYEYPFPDEVNAKLYASYRARAKAHENTVFCGRLGEYRYYDMDQAIERALLISRRLMK